MLGTLENKNKAHWKDHVNWCTLITASGVIKRDTHRVFPLSNCQSQAVSRAMTLDFAWLCAVQSFAFISGYMCSLMKSYNLMRQQRAHSPLFTEDRDKRENTSPGKKKVHFAGDNKENTWPEQRVGIRPQEHVLITKLHAVNVGDVERNYPLKCRPMLGLR
ncbi:serine/threonine-protein kinase Nek2-like [Tachysurus vachellii]|uniref:serine/threonine-protein kinase Nek2-like n=1 Tax=Tachysurus vachellii TaxID=175792 RepID=UPI00296AB29E|nr:serine/threonine-protein kinase Nek2-like [Tachysurus vachellii]